MNYEQVFDNSPSSGQQVFTGSGSFDKNLEYCKKLKGKNVDVLIREYILADGKRCAAIAVDGMTNKHNLEMSITLASRRYSNESYDDICGINQQFGSVEISETESLSDGYISALSGDVLVIVEGQPKVLVCGYRFISSRSVSDSPLTGAVRGPHEAFIETLRLNTALIRRRIADPNLVLEPLTVGRHSRTSVALCYILGITSPKLVEEARRRIQEIDIDIINDSGELEQLIEDDPSALFPQIDGTELPDIVAAELCAGRAAIIVNGSPYVLLLPATLPRLMQAGEDKYQRWSYASFIKLLRWAASIISVIFPSLYVAIVSFHPGMLPTSLLILTAVNRLNVPSSALTEVLIVELALELLREASIRMPKSIGSSLSIVGGIIIGDAALNAGLVSPLLIVVVGISTMAGFVIPSYPLASSYRMVKYILLGLTGIFGLAGLVCGILLWLSAMVSVRSFGVDFAAPLYPFDTRGAGCSFVEIPADARTTRPDTFDPMDGIRMRPRNKMRSERQAEQP